MSQSGAIGTGKTATTEQAEEVCAAIRACIREIYDEATAEAIRIQYGGSVNGGNAAELFAQADIDGGLVGGASLKEEFGKIGLQITRFCLGANRPFDRPAGFLMAVTCARSGRLSPSLEQGIETPIAVL